MLNLPRIRAIGLDLDDTLWPIWPTISRAEGVLLQWLQAHAPATAALHADKAALRAIREQMDTLRPDLAHDLTALRRESIRLALTRAGDDPALAETAFDAFFAERQRVEFYADALPALERLAARWPLVAVTNGNADIARVGLGHLFAGAVNAHTAGFRKPDPRIFHAGANLARVPGDAVLHVGDDAGLDVLGALAAGQQTAWVNRENKPWEHGEQRPHLTVAELSALCDALGV